MFVFSTVVSFLSFLSFSPPGSGLLNFWMTFKDMSLWGSSTKGETIMKRQQDMLIASGRSDKCFFLKFRCPVQCFIQLPLRKLTVHNDWGSGRRRELVYYDKPTHLTAIHLLCLELNLFPSHSMSIIQKESRVFIYSGQQSILLQ